MTAALAVLMDAGAAPGSGGAVPIVAVTSGHFEAWRNAQPERLRHWLGAVGFKADTGAFALVPGDGGLAQVILGLGRGDDPWATGGLAKNLPKGVYRLSEAHGAHDTFATWAALAWALGAYTFGRYKADGAKKQDDLARLEWPAGADRDHVTRVVSAAALTRDLINTPASDMLPDALEKAVRDVGAAFGARVTSIVGDDLLARNYPMIHAVGRASAVAPRLIDLVWGEASAPKVTLVGKGVCFDTGGLDLKTSSGMALMKKDMGGAATLLGLAQMIMAAKLPVRLRLLVPAVENAVAGNSFRPGDILRTRKGTTVEIGNTDAEGRLILADALTEACSETPALLIDAATLTGAARTALGPELPGLFTDDDALAADLHGHAAAAHDHMWRMPLWAPYRKFLDSKVADINNAGDTPFAGAITASLFLKEFVAPGIPWAHFDVYAWNAGEKPGRPAGGEAFTQRALFSLIKARFG